MVLCSHVVEVLLRTRLPRATDSAAFCRDGQLPNLLSNWPWPSHEMPPYRLCCSPGEASIPFISFPDLKLVIKMGFPIVKRKLSEPIHELCLTPGHLSTESPDSHILGLAQLQIKPQPIQIYLSKRSSVSRLTFHACFKVLPSSFRFGSVKSEGGRVSIGITSSRFLWLSAAQLLSA